MHTVDVQKYVYYLISNVSNGNTLICLIVKLVLIFNVSNSNTSTYSNNTSCSQWACSVVCLCVVFPGFPLAVLVYRPVVTGPLSPDPLGVLGARFRTRL